MMRAGTYYVGDLCYVMHPQWSEVCGLMFNTGKGRDGVLDGEFNLANGVRFAIQGTAHGDGVYLDNKGREYPVDAGLIGCIAVEDVYDPEWWLAGMQTITFNHPFTVEYDQGVITFVEQGPGRYDRQTVLTIDTDPPYNDLEDEFDEEETV